MAAISASEGGGGEGGGSVELGKRLCRASRRICGRRVGGWRLVVMRW